MIGIIGYGLVLPLGLYMRLRRHRHHTSTVEARWETGFLFQGYRYCAYYFEILIFLRKLFMLLVAVIPDEMYRLIGVAAISIIGVQNHFIFKPFDYRRKFILQRLDALLTLTYATPCLTQMILGSITRFDKNNHFLKKDTLSKAE